MDVALGLQKSNNLSLTKMGRCMPGNMDVKHKIKKVIVLKEISTFTKNFTSFIWGYPALYSRWYPMIRLSLWLLSFVCKGRHRYSNAQCRSCLERPNNSNLSRSFWKRWAARSRRWFPTRAEKMVCLLIGKLSLLWMLVFMKIGFLQLKCKTGIGYAEHE